MAGNTRDLIVRIVGDARQMKKATKEAESGLDAFEGKIGDLGKTLAGVFAGGALIAFAKQAATAALEDARAQERLAKTLQNVTGATDDQVAAVEKSIAAMESQFAVADDQLRPAFEALVRSTKDVGQAQSLMQLALDVSAGSGKDLQSVALALVKAMGGQTRSLKELGINVKTASGETASFAEIQRQLNDMFGGQAATAADSQSGRLAALSIQYENLKENIGAALLPVMIQLADVANSLFGWFNNLDEGTQRFLVQLVAFSAAAYGAVKAFLAIKAAVVAMNVSMAATPWGAIAAGIGIVAGAFLLSRNASESATTSTEGYVDALRMSTEESKKAVEAKVLEVLANEDIAYALELAGVKASEAAKYILGYTDSIDVSGKAAVKYGDNIVPLILFLEGQRREMQKARIDAAELAKTEEELAGATGESATASDEATKATDKLTGSTFDATTMLDGYLQKKERDAEAAEEWRRRVVTAFDRAFGRINQLVSQDRALASLRDVRKEYLETVKKLGETSNEALEQQSLYVAALQEGAQAAAKSVPGYDLLSEAQQRASDSQFIVTWARNLQSTIKKGSPLWIALQNLIDQFWALAGAQSTSFDMINSIQLPGGVGPKPAPKPKGRRAAGGPVSAGSAYLVGEMGPELFVPSAAGTIIPNGAGGNITVNVTAPTGTDPYTWGNAIVSALKSYVRSNGKLVGLTA